MKNCELCKGRGWCGGLCDHPERMESKLQCLKCKGRLYCGRKFCAIAAKSEAMFKVKDLIGKEDFCGSAPAPFIGHYGYPNLNVGILSLQEKDDKAWLYDAPKFWADNDFEIPQIIDFRSQLVNSRFKAHIRDVNKLLEINQEIGMASKPVDMEINLDSKPRFRVKTDAFSAPMGPNAKLIKAYITSNPKIHTKVDKVVSDTDLKSEDALTYLYDSNFDENFLTKILSVGTLGIKKNRKLVPTRFSITAVDSNLGNYLNRKIKDFPEYGYSAYFGSYLGNYYLILTFPEIWSYELFEMYKPEVNYNTSNKIEYTTDYESYSGRKNYAEECAGGFYSVRLAILEKLNRLKRQASILVIRIITDEYAVPLGVFVTREAARKALKNKPITFSSKELLITYTKNFIKKKFGFDITPVLSRSIILRNLKEQSKLTKFI